MRLCICAHGNVVDDPNNCGCVEVPAGMAGSLPKNPPPVPKWWNIIQRIRRNLRKMNW
jgi:hypothetical protein